LDARNVEMHILTETGKTIAIVCPRDSIFAIQQHIEQMGKACPEIATWSNQYRAMLTRADDPHRLDAVVNPGTLRQIPLKQTA
jgi:hypothetical protein